MLNCKKSLICEFQWLNKVETTKVFKGNIEKSIEKFNFDTFQGFLLYVIITYKSLFDSHSLLTFPSESMNMPKTALSHRDNDVFERLMKINVELKEIPFL